MSLFVRILIRWAGNSFGIWVAGRLITDVVHSDNITAILLAGLALSLVNSVVKPLIVMLSLPALVLTLGLFIVIVNGLMVWLAAVVVPGFEILDFGSAILAGLVIGLVNYIMTILLD